MQYALDDVGLVTANGLTVVLAGSHIAIRLIVFVDKSAQPAKSDLCLRGVRAQENFLGLRVLELEDLLVRCLVFLRLSLHVDSPRVTVQLANIHVLCRLEKPRRRRHVGTLARQRLLTRSARPHFCLVAPSEQAILFHLILSEDSRVRHSIFFKHITLVHCILTSAFLLQDLQLMV